jgi:hypothetical protein
MSQSETGKINCVRLRRYGRLSPGVPSTTARMIIGSLGIFCGAQRIILTLFGTMRRNFLYVLFVNGCQLVPGFSVGTKEFV